MRALLINTCGERGVVALADAGVVVAEMVLPGRGSSESLVPAVRALLHEKRLQVNDLQAIGVVTGPGSFTGVRVGLSTAKGLCEAGRVGLIAMSRLELLVAGKGADAVAALDAGRGEYYCGRYPEGLAAREEMVSAEELRRISLGSRLVSCEQRVVKSLDIAVELVAEPGGAAMLVMVERRVLAGHWSDVATVDANYLRRTDAELLVHGR